jgi:hypothetical protein
LMLLPNKESGEINAPNAILEFQYLNLYIGDKKKRSIFINMPYIRLLFQ